MSHNWAIMHLTNKEPSHSDPAVSEAEAKDAGAPENEIEITPEMVDAGYYVVSLYGPEGAAPAWGWLEMAYRAMRELEDRPSKHACTQRYLLG
jgi:hypothetical protein